ncbi:MAG: hypothetical protein CR997_09425 [Acidobacteria bacterium]|nr:MAG: hypothetical protein CR997_09425 [Acidobacteriota bacterium]
MNSSSLFGKEENILKNAKASLESKGDLTADFKTLLKGYEKLFKQTRRLVRLSDRQQLRLNSLNESLELRNRFITGVFGRYLSDDIVEELLQTPGGLQLGGEKRRMTILMSDLRGFTALAEKLPADQVLQILNHYLEEMTEIIFKHQGTIDEILGDGLLVIFGVPTTREDDATRAIACAIDMQIAMERVNRWNQKHGFPELKLGVGLHTGDVIVGNIGSTKRTKYGVVGREVNLTARIESYTVGDQILISKAARDACLVPLAIRSQSEVFPKGCSGSIQILDVEGIQGGPGLPANREVLTELSVPVPVQYRVLTGKDVNSEEQEGVIVACAKSQVAIVQSEKSPPFTNVKISYREHEIYGKVIKQKEENQDDRSLVVLTSLPADVQAFMRALNKP